MGKVGAAKKMLAKKNAKDKHDLGFSDHQAHYDYNVVVHLI